MKQIQISPTGKVTYVYDDVLALTLKTLGELKVGRASNVEWEDYLIPSTGQRYTGWTVRSAAQPLYRFLQRSPADGSIEVTHNGGGLPAFFPTREEALREEVAHFWELLPKEN